MEKSYFSLAVEGYYCKSKQGKNGENHHLPFFFFLVFILPEKNAMTHNIDYLNLKLFLFYKFKEYITMMHSICIYSALRKGVSRCFLQHIMSIQANTKI